MEKTNMENSKTYKLLNEIAKEAAFTPTEKKEASDNQALKEMFDIDYIPTNRDELAFTLTEKISSLLFKLGYNKIKYNKDIKIEKENLYAAALCRQQLIIDELYNKLKIIDKLERINSELQKKVETLLENHNE